MKTIIILSIFVICAVFVVSTTWAQDDGLEGLPEDLEVAAARHGGGFGGRGHGGYGGRGHGGYGGGYGGRGHGYGGYGGYGRR